MVRVREVGGARRASETVAKRSQAQRKKPADAPTATSACRRVGEHRRPSAAKQVLLYAAGRNWHRHLRNALRHRRIAASRSPSRLCTSSIQHPTAFLVTGCCLGSHRSLTFTVLQFFSPGYLSVLAQATCLCLPRQPVCAQGASRRVAIDWD